jgi:hypothetical protein
MQEGVFLTGLVFILAGLILWLLITTEPQDFNLKEKMLSMIDHPIYLSKPHRENLIEFYEHMEKLEFHAQDVVEHIHKQSLFANDKDLKLKLSRLKEVINDANFIQFD